MNDKVSGKYTLVVMMGVLWGKRYHCFLLILSAVCLVCYGSLVFESLWQWAVIWVLFPMLYHLVVVCRHQSPQELNPQLKYLSLLTFLTAFSILMVLNWI